MSEELRQKCKEGLLRELEAIKAEYEPLIEVVESPIFNMMLEKYLECEKILSFAKNNSIEDFKLVFKKEWGRLFYKIVDDDFYENNKKIVDIFVSNEDRIKNLFFEAFYRKILKKAVVGNE